MSLSEVHQCFWVVIFFFFFQAYDRITAAEKLLNITTNSSETVGVVRLFWFFLVSDPPLKVHAARLRCQSSVRAVMQ